MNRVFTLLILLLPFYTSAQIWRETFDGLANGTTNDNGATSWTTTLPSGGAASFSKQTPVAGYQVFVINDTGSEGVWRSQTIDISSYTEVAIELTLYSYFTFSSDYIRCYYRINGGPEVQFGELLGSNGLNITSAASAIVSGSTLQIVVRGRDNTPGTSNTYGFPIINGLAFDDVTLTSIRVLYSRASANWNANASWSTSGHTGASCNCTPDDVSRVIIGNNHTISMPAAATAAGVTVLNTGTLRYTAATSLTLARGGTITVDNGGILTRNGINGTSIVYNAYAYTLNINGDLTVEDIDANAGANITFNGSGYVDIADDFLVGIGSGRTITNNLTGGLIIGDQLNFEPTSSDATFINNAVLYVGANTNGNRRIFFDSDNVQLINNGTAVGTVNGIYVNNNDDDGNSVTNNGTLTFSSINLNYADFTFNNSGTVTQVGNFINIALTSSINNLDGGTWNFSGGGNLLRLFAGSGDNTFNYSANGNQTIYLPVDGYSNLTLSGSGVKSLSNNTNVSRTLSIEGNAQLDATASNYNLQVGGDWTVTSGNANPFAERSGSVIFNGTASQSINTNLPGGETFHNLNVNKSSGWLALDGTDVNVSNTLTLASGGVDLNSNTLHITRGNTNALVRINGFIRSEGTNPPHGAVRRRVGTTTGSYLFPMAVSADAADYIPFTFNITSAGTGATGTVSLSTYRTDESNLPYPTGVSNLESYRDTDNSVNTVKRFWNIDVENFSTNPTATVTFVATPDEVGTISILRAQRWNSSTSAWDAPIEGQTNPTAYSATVPGVQNFSPWTLSGNNIALPITLREFSAVLKSGKVHLDWATAQELNNDYFTVERSVDMENFETIAEVTGQGTSNKEQTYSAIDPAPYIGVSYYRLKQTDFDGTVTVFDPVRIDFEGSVWGSLHAYPTLVRDNEINIKIRGARHLSTVPVSLYSSRGELVFRMVLAGSGTDEIAQKVQLPATLAAGLYILRAGPTFDLTTKIVVE